MPTPRITITHLDHGEFSQTAQIELDGTPRVGVIVDTDCDGDPTLVLWDSDGEAVASLPLGPWLAGRIPTGVVAGRLEPAAAAMADPAGSGG